MWAIIFPTGELGERGFAGGFAECVVGSSGDRAVRWVVDIALIESQLSTLAQCLLAGCARPPLLCLPFPFLSLIFVWRYLEGFLNSALVYLSCQVYS